MLNTDRLHCASPSKWKSSGSRKILATSPVRRNFCSHLSPGATDVVCAKENPFSSVENKSGTGPLTFASFVSHSSNNPTTGARCVSEKRKSLRKLWSLSRRSSRDNIAAVENEVLIVKVGINDDVGNSLTRAGVPLVGTLGPLFFATYSWRLAVAQ